MTIAIGTKLYYFDTDYNRGRSHAERFKTYTIVGETRQSWLIKREGYENNQHLEAERVNKETMRAMMRGKGYGTYPLLTREQMLDDIWRADNRAIINKAFDDNQDISKLKEIAKILGVESKP